MKPSKEYLDSISKRLEAMNPHLVNGVNIFKEPYKVPNIMDQIGETAMAYLKNKPSQIPIENDTLFPDRNSY